MSDVLPTRPVRPPALQALGVRAVVRLSRALARLSPRHLRLVLTVASRGARPAERGETTDVRDVVLSGSAYCRGGSACLPRSIAVVLLSRLRGRWPAWCVGVLAVPPFTAHAWVEVGGEIVDEPMRRSDFRTFFVVAARDDAGAAHEPGRPVAIGR